MLKKCWIFRHKSEMFRFNKINCQRNWKILRMKKDGGSWKERTLMRKLLMPRSVLLRNDSTVRKSNCLRRNLSWTRSPILLINSRKMPLKEDSQLLKFLKRSISFRVDSETSLGRWKQLSQNSQCVRPISSSTKMKGKTLKVLWKMLGRGWRKVSHQLPKLK